MPRRKLDRQDLLRGTTRGRTLDKDEWMEQVNIHHDLMTTEMHRRDQAILRALASGATAAEIVRGMKGRLSRRRVYQVLEGEGVRSRGRPGSVPGQAPPIPKKSGLSHLQDFQR